MVGRKNFLIKSANIFLWAKCYFIWAVPVLESMSLAPLCHICVIICVPASLYIILIKIIFWTLIARKFTSELQTDEKAKKKRQNGTKNLSIQCFQWKHVAMSLSSLD